jgi:hypothetical protein
MILAFFADFSIFRGFFRGIILDNRGRLLVQ